MEFNEIEKFISKLTSKCTVLSITIGGLWLKVDFTGSNFKDIYTFSIETDSWIFVDDINSKNDYSSIIKDENNFNKYRRKSILGIYDLTGYDINSINLTKKGLLQLFINNKKISFLPYEDDQNHYYEGPYWHVIVNSDRYGDYWTVNNEDGELVINDKIDWASTDLKLKTIKPNKANQRGSK